jgi:hypothetical protein
MAEMNDLIKTAFKKSRATYQSGGHDQRKLVKVKLA